MNTMSDNSETQPNTLGPVEIGKIMECLPHRYPFLLVDRVLSIETGERPKITALKNVTINEPFFQGHFPQNPVMPGVLIIEALAQAAGLLAALSAENQGAKGNLYYLVKVDKARFSKVVSPGDQIILEVEQKRIMRGMGQYACAALVDGKRVSSCEILCAGRRA